MTYQVDNRILSRRFTPTQIFAIAVSLTVQSRLTLLRMAYVKTTANSEVFPFS